MSLYLLVMMPRWLVSVTLSGCLLGAVYACDSTTNEITPGVGGGGGAGGQSSTGGSGAGSSQCVGVEPPAEAYGAEPGPQLTGGGGSGGSAAGGMGGSGGADLLPIDVGAEAPVYQLHDFQPQSCGYDATYGLEVFRGQATVVALWAGW